MPNTKAKRRVMFRYGHLKLAEHQYVYFATLWSCQSERVCLSMEKNFEVFSDELLFNFMNTGLSGEIFRGEGEGWKCPKFTN